MLCALYFSSARATSTWRAGFILAALQRQQTEQQTVGRCLKSMCLPRISAAQRVMRIQHWILHFSTAMSLPFDRRLRRQEGRRSVWMRI
eukprot:4085908-Pleurochrysis_carterae.AAC.1